MKDNPSLIQGPEEDRAAVDAVITREIDAFHNKDFAAWSDCYLHSDRLRSTMMSHELGLDVRYGWQAFAASTRPHFDSDAPVDGEWRKEVESIEVVGDMAWLTCRAYASLNICMMGESYETWVLERHDGQWKVVCTNVMAARAHSSQGRRLALDGEGHIVDGSPHILSKIAAHPALMVRGGRLRALHRDVDKALQDAIARAAQLHGFFEQAAYAEMEGQRFAFPLVLEREGDGGHEVLLLTVQDRLTYLDFGTDAETRTRVDASAAIFRLSESQHKVAQGIVEGKSLPQIAEGAGISPTTAKTHLKRVYEKTGTASMTALVRTLVSLG